ncbi:hypothetical protein QR680_010604 [Steinernema hermaphroditum]|uniref:Uncharacterized protein n=1 Tax=Steinernema hermaphroditum TaxID=289476 RepID=A0AA39IQR5_9BILA|nr:hypothetical protein QR680_010604 [Steinernema hermaphroditum]
MLAAWQRADVRADDGDTNTIKGKSDAAASTPPKQTDEEGLVGGPPTKNSNSNHESDSEEREALMIGKRKEGVNDGELLPPKGDTRLERKESAGAKVRKGERDDRLVVVPSASPPSRRRTVRGAIVSCELTSTDALATNLRRVVTEHPIELPTLEIVDRSTDQRPTVEDTSIEVSVHFGTKNVTSPNSRRVRIVQPSDVVQDDIRTTEELD